MKKSVRFTTSNQAHHVVGPAYPIHLPGYVTLNHCLTPDTLINLRTSYY